MKGKRSRKSPLDSAFLLSFVFLWSALSSSGQARAEGIAGATACQKERCIRRPGSSFAPLMWAVSYVVQSRPDYVEHCPGADGERGWTEYNIAMIHKVACD